MRMLRLPSDVEAKGIKLPDVVVLEPGEPVPVEGMPYIRAHDTDTDETLLFRLMIPWLEKTYPEFNWREIYHDKVGRKWVKPSQLIQMSEDFTSSVDLEVLMSLGMMPTFCEDIAKAITVNLSNEYKWFDGYNKKTGFCSGNMVRMPRARTLIIMDVSWSIPDGASAGLIMLLGTMTSITNADLIITGKESFFYPNEEAVKLTPEEIRAVPRGNEKYMFREILKTYDMDYDIVIAFGDNDNPDPIGQYQKVNIKEFHSYFTGVRDCYGVSHKSLAGYGRWIPEWCESVKITSHTDWIRFFNE